MNNHPLLLGSLYRTRSNLSFWFHYQKQSVEILRNTIVMPIRFVDGERVLGVSEAYFFCCGYGLVKRAFFNFEFSDLFELYKI